MSSCPYELACYQQRFPWGQQSISVHVHQASIPKYATWWRSNINPVLECKNLTFMHDEDTQNKYYSNDNDKDILLVYLQYIQFVVHWEKRTNVGSPPVMCVSKWSENSQSQNLLFHLPLRLNSHRPLVHLCRYWLQGTPCPLWHTMVWVSLKPGHLRPLSPKPGHFQPLLPKPDQFHPNQATFIRIMC